MKLTTMVGGVKFSYETPAELVGQLEAKLAELDKELAGYDGLKKRRWFIAQALKQMKGEDVKAAKAEHPAKV